MTMKVLYASIDKRGNVICPVCSKPVLVPRDAWLAPGVGNCKPDGSGHPFAISERDAMKANEILEKQTDGAWRKPINRNFGGIPKEIAPEEDDDGKGILL